MQVMSKVFVALLLLCLLGHCESNNSDSTIEASGLPIIGISESLKYAKASMTSTANSTNSTQMFGLSSTLAQTQSTVDPTCSTKGDAYNLSVADKTYPFKQIYCKASINSYEDNTIIGFLDQWASILCGMQEALGGTFNWQESPTAQSLSATLAAGNCFSQSLYDMLTSKGLTSPVAITNLMLYQLDGTGGFDYRMTFAVAVLGQTIDFYFRSDEKYLAYKLAIDVADGTTWSTAVSIDRVNQELRFEKIDLANNSYLTHYKFLIKGTLNATTGEFSEINEGAGLWVSGDQSKGQWEYYATIKSLGGGNIIGNSSYQGNGGAIDAGNVTSNRCGADGNGNCPGNTGIPLTDSELDSFYTARNTYTSNFRAAEVISFSDVALTTTATSITGR